MDKIYINLVKVITGIKKKIIIWMMLLSGSICLMFAIPEIAISLRDTLDKLDNDCLKNFISIFTDVNILINEYIKIDKYCIIYSTLVIFILCIVVLIMKYIYKNEEIVDKVIIGHSSMSKVQFKVQTNSKYKNEEINLISDMNDIGSDYEKIKYVVNRQDKFIEEFKQNINNVCEYGYMGIAHTPLILRMGSQIGDEVAITLFHKYRTGKTKVFRELEEYKNFKGIEVTTEILDKSSDELIVGLSTTYPIKYDELKIFKPDDKNILIFSSEQLGCDVITSKNQVEYYVQFMMNSIKQVVKDKNITKIHMVLSTSVAMTFALGQAISVNNEPELIIYHYDKSKSEIYTWGINLFKNYNDCLVITS